MAQEPEIKPASGFECFIRLYNKTDVEFLLYDSKAKLGTWAKGSPPNTVEPNTEVLIQLNDDRGFSGSEGEVVYELYHPKQPDKPISFRLEFCDPYGRWNDNYLKARPGNPKLISCNVLDYQSTGHPFSGHVEVYLADSGAADAESGQDQGDQPLSVSQNTSGRKVHANYEIGFDPAVGYRKQPVHEDIAIAAFIASAPKTRFSAGTNYNNLNRQQWEYMRGLIWNDDPSCLLLSDVAESNCEFDPLGGKFALAFEFGPENCMTKRSHFGNMQFLHGMASSHGQDPNLTKARAMAWLEVMYKLAIGQDVTEKDSLDKVLPHDFGTASEPSGSATLRDLLLGTTRSYRRPDIPRRALGSCLHLIQDAYAVGHTLRRLRNPGDLDGRDGEGYFQFRPGTWAKLGPIITFHTYAGQSSRHGHYDESNRGRDPRDPGTFDHIIGARDAIEKSTRLINFYAARTRWEDGVADLFAAEVLALDQHVTPSNSEVDERFGLPDTSGAESVDTSERRWEIGLERKLALLEAGGVHGEGVVNARPAVRRVAAAVVPVLKWALLIVLVMTSLCVLFLK